MAQMADEARVVTSALVGVTTQKSDAPTPRVSTDPGCAQGPDRPRSRVVTLTPIFFLTPWKVGEGDYIDYRGQEAQI